MVIRTVSRDAACSASAVDPSGSGVTVDDKGAMSSATMVRAKGKAMVEITVDGIRCLTPRVDSYGHTVQTMKRGRGCKCPTPCQGRFTCMSSHHRGSRSTPYCRGCADEEEERTGVEVCDDCWCRRERNREKARARRAA